MRRKKQVIGGVVAAAVLVAAIGVWQFHESQREDGYLLVAQPHATQYQQMIAARQRQHTPAEPPVETSGTWRTIEENAQATIQAWQYGGTPFTLAVETHAHAYLTSSAPLMAGYVLAADLERFVADPYSVQTWGATGPWESGEVQARLTAGDYYLYVYCASDVDCQVVDTLHVWEWN